MLYLSAENLTKSYGIKPLFNNLTCHVAKGDKIAIVARNGTGKSTLLKIFAGKETSEEGKVTVNKEVQALLFEQTPLLTAGMSVIDNVFKNNNPVMQLIKEYELAVEDHDADKINELLPRMEDASAWDFESKVEQILTRLNIHHLHQNVELLSGGEQKRVALARTLIEIGFDERHTLLLMDEPTNHLDIEMVEWLEYFLNQSKTTLVMVTHDRYFLDRVCNVIWEIENEELFVHRGDYENFLYNKAVRIENSLSEVDKAKNLYRKELAWMRKQPKARTTKSKSRIDAFFEVEKKAKTIIEDQNISLGMKMTRLGGKVVDMKKVYKSFGNKVILKGFDYLFNRNERIGIIGKNGVGKSTLINLVQGLIPPDSGKINVGETVVFGYFSQQGLVIKKDRRVIEFVKDIAENFPMADGSTLSASQFLKLFLFKDDQQYGMISKLSGGEKRRLHLLSILFNNPNFLILDEPTNDLDIQTLGVLENFLAEFKGTVMIVSHDRYFMDRLVDHLFVFEGDGVISDFPGNYTEYREMVKKKKNVPERYVAEKIMETPATKSASSKLTYLEKKELQNLEVELKSLSKEQKQIELQLTEGGEDYLTLQNLGTKLLEIKDRLNKKELRWLELSEKTEK